MIMVSSDSKERFSNRVDDYVRYRPSYPPAILEVLRDDCGLAPESLVADVGSGTGLLAQLFLENGNVVYGVEPNAAMRVAGEQFLEKYPHFCSVAGSAEATALPDSSVDFIVSGQAFHWFDPRAARTEFRRVLKPGGWVAVVANAHLRDAVPLHRQYEALLRKYGTDYAKVFETYSEYRRMKDFFRSASYARKTFPNEQQFDFEGLRGRLLSASYTPREGHPHYEPMLAELKKIFEACEEGGYVRFGYTTEIHYGHLESP
jgi:ubiquinone/menaquinone biosynthesis C-methylase UbiE